LKLALIESLKNDIKSEKKPIDKSRATIQKQKSKPVAPAKSEMQMKEDFLNNIRIKKAKKIEPVFTISNDFSLGLSIGSGAFATVYRAVHKQSGFSVALKTYEKKLLTHRS
jgi:hypothetical protein